MLNAHEMQKETWQVSQSYFFSTTNIKISVGNVSNETEENKNYKKMVEWYPTCTT